MLINIHRHRHHYQGSHTSGTQRVTPLTWGRCCCQPRRQQCAAWRHQRWCRRCRSGSSSSGNTAWRHTPSTWWAPGCRPLLTWGTWSKQSHLSSTDGPGVFIVLSRVQAVRIMVKSWWVNELSGAQTDRGVKGEGRGRGGRGGRKSGRESKRGGRKRGGVGGGRKRERETERARERQRTWTGKLYFYKKCSSCSVRL